MNARAGWPQATRFVRGPFYGRCRATPGAPRRHPEGLAPSTAAPAIGSFCRLPRGRARISLPGKPSWPIVTSITRRRRDRRVHRGGEMDVARFLASLRDVSSSPLALAAYVVLACAWVARLWLV